MTDRESSDFEALYDVFSWETATSYEDAMEVVENQAQGLVLSDFNIFEDEVEELMSVVAHSKYIKALRFCNSELDEVASVFIKKIMSSSNLSTYDVIDFAPTLRDNLALRYFRHYLFCFFIVSLANNLLDDEAVNALGLGLIRNSALTVLNLAGNKITLADSDNNFFKYLPSSNFRGNKISEEGALNLSKAIKGNKSLIFLDVSENTIEATVATKLALVVPDSVYYVGPKVSYTHPGTRMIRANKKKKKARARASVYMTVAN
eukprot:maker-scaffold_27-snap-gene-2.52-mRNA-1 protein AED:0.21 eAED:0.21 QI:142/0.8/0.83/1/1/1/6/214/261